MGSNVFPDRLGPANSDIAAAVAAPSAATIAAAVAAPSSATIATAVAAAVPAIGAINTSVANNASPFGGTWAFVGSATFNNTQSATVSGLSSYKYLLISWDITHSLTNDVYLRLNGNSSSVYTYIASKIGNSGVTNNACNGCPSFQIGNDGVNAGDTFTGFLEVFGAQSASHKLVKGRSVFRDPSQVAWIAADLTGLYTSTSGISSVTVLSSRATGNQGTLRVQGAN